MPAARSQQCDLLQVNAKFGRLEVSEAKRLRELKEENFRLKKLMAEAMLHSAVLKDLASKNVWSAPPGKHQMWLAAQSA